MSTVKVEVVEYNRDWPALFEEEVEKIRNILGDELIEIHHIGSTSVEHLKAKPIIDIMPVVKDIEKVDNYNEEFIKLGYEPKGEYGIPGRRFFRKGGTIRTHHVHIFDINNTNEIVRHLAVRDYLRTHPQDAYEYGELKSKLAALYPWDIEAYCNGKDAFVKELERKALEWYLSAKK
ncbi:MAG TPA: GrpB family protein [Clostridiales bacterium]|nr:GrpB family protein [Clostridiales bacterium]